MNTKRNPNGFQAMSNAARSPHLTSYGSHGAVTIWLRKASRPTSARRVIVQWDVLVRSGGNVVHNRVEPKGWRRE